jgi:hypothetical protein
VDFRAIITSITGDCLTIRRRTAHPLTRIALLTNRSTLGFLIVKAIVRSLIGIYAYLKVDARGFSANPTLTDSQIDEKAVEFTQKTYKTQ